MKKIIVLMLLCIIVLFGCPINGEDGSDGKDAKSKLIEIFKSLTTVIIYEGIVPDKEQVINLKDYITNDQEVYLIVYNVKNEVKTLCCPAFVFNYKLDSFDWESEIIKDSKQFDLVVTKDSVIKWTSFGDSIKIVLKY